MLSVTDGLPLLVLLDNQSCLGLKINQDKLPLLWNLTNRVRTEKMENLFAVHPSLSQYQAPGAPPPRRDRMAGKQTKNCLPKKFYICFWMKQKSSADISSLPETETQMQSNILGNHFFWVFFQRTDPLCTNLSQSESGSCPGNGDKNVKRE